MDVTLKKNSKEALKGNWGTACAFLLIILGLFASFQMLQGAVETIFDFSSKADIPFNIFNLPTLLQNPDFVIPMISILVFAILQFFSFVPMTFGYTTLFFHIVEGKSVETAQIFSYFSSFKLYLKTIWMTVNLLARSLFWAIILLMPGLLSLLISSQISSNYSLSSNQTATMIATVLGFLGIPLLVIGILFLAVILQKYFLARYIFIQDNTKKVTDCIRFSILMMKGNKKDVLFFRLSFIGWILLIPITLFVGSLYVMPYQSASFAAYARSIIISKFYEFHQSRMQETLQEGIHP